MCDYCLHGHDLILAELELTNDIGRLQFLKNKQNELHQAEMLEEKAKELQEQAGSITLRVLKELTT